MKNRNKVLELNSKYQELPPAPQSAIQQIALVWPEIKEAIDEGATCQQIWEALKECGWTGAKATFVTIVTRFKKLRPLQISELAS